MSLIKTEPVAAGIMTLVGALIALLVAFGVDLTATQQAAISAFVVAALALALVVRSRVTPVAK